MPAKRLRNVVSSVLWLIQSRIFAWKCKWMNVRLKLSRLITIKDLTKLIRPDTPGQSDTHWPRDCFVMHIYNNTRSPFSEFNSVTCLYTWFQLIRLKKYFLAQVLYLKLQITSYNGYNAIILVFLIPYFTMCSINNIAGDRFIHLPFDQLDDVQVFLEEVCGINDVYN
jgi:hypothetical protein